MQDKARPRATPPPGPLPEAERGKKNAAGNHPLRPLAVALIAYVGLLGVTVAHAVHATLADGAPDRARVIRDAVAAEVVGGLVVAAAVALSGRPPRFAPAWPGRAWLLVPPLFAAAVAGNVGYTRLLRWAAQTLGVDAPDPDPGEFALSAGAWVAVLLACAQPAVVEEVFFRHVLLGHLRPHLGLHAAVWATAAAFALAHLGTVGAWPLLVTLGAGLGYARALSGRLALPVALHFLHNLALLAAHEWGAT